MPFQKGNQYGRQMLGYRHTEATRQKIREKRALQVITEEQKRKTSKTMKGGNSSSFKKGMTPWNKGKSHLVGEKHPNWRGGITSWKKRIWCSKEYKSWRFKIFERDGFRCSICLQQKNGKLEVDHYPKQMVFLLHENNINSFEEAIKCKTLWNISNGRTLCVDCHKKFGLKERIKK